METYLPWFILRELPGLTDRAINGLIQKFHTPEAILTTAPGILADSVRLSPKALNSLQAQNKYVDQAQQTLARVLSRRLKITTLTDPSYPALLKEIPDPPPLLIFDGKLSPGAPCISIVGSRTATRYGLDTAAHLARALAARGFTVVSGMALGIDTAAHKGALDGAGTTLAVLGSGLGHIYPRQNTALYDQIRNCGAVISEHPVDTPPLPGHFPRRNRIIAGLSTGTVVVEAAERSGSLITARLAGEYNREVFAVPGSIASSKSRGTHALIRQGARLVENENDIIEELSQFVHPAPRGQGPVRHPLPPAMDKTQALVYKHLDPYPRHIDQITASTGLESGVIAATLLDMELSGLIVRHPGNKFSKSEE